MMPVKRKGDYRTVSLFDKSILVSAPVECVPAIGWWERVIVVLGFHNNQREAEEIVRQAYPKAEIEFYTWESSPDFSSLRESLSTVVNPNSGFWKLLAVAAGTLLQKAAEWLKARTAADEEVAKLTEKLCKLPADIREKTVLIGHSLGGRMVVKTLAELAKKQLKVKRAVLMGSAISIADESIEMAVNATVDGIENRINPKDHVLTKIYEPFGEILATEKKALGAHKVSFTSPKWKDIEVENGNPMNHLFEFYWYCGKLPENEDENSLIEIE